MKTSFTAQLTGATRATTGTIPQPDEVYDLRGANLIAPDQVMPKGESPKAENCRMYAREESQSRVAIRTRKGSRRLSTPVGEALNVQNVAAASGGDAQVTVNNWIAFPFVPSSTGPLTRLDLEVKLVTVGLGPMIIQIFTNNAGVPGTMIAEGAIQEGATNGSFQFLPSYYIDAPSVTNGSTYWALCKVQAGGSAVYALNKTAAAGALTTVNPGTVFSAAGYTVRYKSYLSTAGSIKGFHRWYPSNLANRTIFAMNNDVYSVTDAGVASSISSAINTLASKVRYAQVNDTLFWVDGSNTPKQWDGTTVTDVMNAPTTPTHVIVHQNRLFYVPSADPTRVVFSDLFAFTSYPSVNFFYVPNPKSPDKIAGWLTFQDNLVILTHETKHVIYGSDLGSFTRKESIGTKGAVSQEAMCADRNYVYFMADDKQIYRWNGSDDECISEKIEPLLNAIQDTSKVRLSIYRNQLRVHFAANSDTTASDMVLCELSRKDSNKYLQWFHDTGRPVIGNLEWYLNNNELIEFSSKCGAFYLGETDESDLGKPIDFKYWTAYQAYGSGSAKDRIKKFRPYLRPTDSPLTMQIGKDIDFNNDPTMNDYLVNPGGAIWGNFVWGDGTIWGDNVQLIQDSVPMSGRGNFTQYRFECSQVEAPVELYGFLALVKVGRIR